MRKLSILRMIQLYPFWPVCIIIIITQRYIPNSIPNHNKVHDDRKNVNDSSTNNISDSEMAEAIFLTGNLHHVLSTEKL